MRERVSCRGTYRKGKYGINLLTFRKYGVDHRNLKPEENLVKAKQVSGKGSSDAFSCRDANKLYSIVPLIYK